MEQVTEFFKGLFDTNLWPPRWHCGKWTQFHGWLYIISDLLIFSAYFAIPVIIVRFIATRTNSRFHTIYFLFAAFILACGLTHLLDAVTFWYPVYRFNALVRLITGLISWTTVFYLFKILPVAFSLKTASELEAEIQQRKKVEEDLKIKIGLLNEAQEIAKLGHWEWDIQHNTFTLSDNLFKIYGLIPNSENLSYDQFLGVVYEEDRHAVDTAIQQSLTDKKFNEFYYRVPTSDGRYKTIHMKGEIITADNLEIQKVVGTCQDVSRQKRTEQELMVKSNLLESKNNELERFAYVASHDLQEPLRKIRTFILRLQNPENNDSEEKRKVYREKIENAASRMQNLIEDVLSFSRLSSIESSLFENTDLNSILSAVLSDMEIAIESNNAVIKSDDLPVISANATQVRQLFQNIIGNAIKFRKEDLHPEIEIRSMMLSGSEVDAPEWVKARYKFSGWNESKFWAREKFCKISISDNGIGFDQQYGDRIFEAFQRLSKNYEGTGIGLAICKKIIENHNGFIAVSSVPGEGTTFAIVLPVSQYNFTQ